jgi:hypothetical protein
MDVIVLLLTGSRSRLEEGKIVKILWQLIQTSRGEV